GEAGPARQVGDGLGHRRVLAHQADAPARQQPGGLETLLDPAGQLLGAAPDLGVVAAAGFPQRLQRLLPPRLQLPAGGLAVPRAPSPRPADGGSAWAWPPGRAPGPPTAGASPSPPACAGGTPSATPAAAASSQETVRMINSPSARRRTRDAPGPPHAVSRVRA